MKNNASTFSPLKSIATLLLATVAVSCGLPETNKPEIKPVSPLDGATALNLGGSGSDVKRSYEGNLLIWKNGTTREDVGSILEATRQANQAEMAKYNFSEKFLNESQTATLKAEIAAIEGKLSDLKNLQGQGATGDRALLIEQANAWFPGVLAQLEAEFPETYNANQATQVFAKYCDAKLWEFADSPVLADGQFSVRPTAAAVCESFYESTVEGGKVNYFADEASCDVNPDGKKSFYECIWRSLKKTQILLKLA